MMTRNARSCLTRMRATCHWRSAVASLAYGGGPESHQSDFLLFQSSERSATEVQGSGEGGLRMCLRSRTISEAHIWAASDYPDGRQGIARLFPAWGLKQCHDYTVAANHTGFFASICGACHGCRQHRSGCFVAKRPLSIIFQVIGGGEGDFW